MVAVSVWPHSGQVMSDDGSILKSIDCTGVSMGGSRSNIRAGRRVCRRRNCQMLQPVAPTDTRIIFAAPDWKLPSRQWPAGLFAHGELGAIDRMALLTGTPAETTGADLGPVVGAGLCVRRGTVEATLESANPMSVAALSNATGAGATCGVCRPALTGMFNVHRHRHTAAPKEALAHSA